MSLYPLRSALRFILPAALLACIAGCGNRTDSPASNSAATNSTAQSAAPTKADPNRPIRVLATTTLAADLVKSIGGPRVQVETLIGPGLDPHLYKARESDLRKLAEAELVFFQGLGLEARMGEVLRQHHAPLGDSVAIAEVIPENKLLSKGEGQAAIDPHVWMNPTLWVLTAEPVAEILSKADPKHAADYKKRAADWTQSLQTLHADLQKQYATIPQSKRVLVTAHDAFGYLGAAYGLEVRGLQGVSTMAEAGAADVDNLSKFLVERGIGTVFVETSVPTRGLEALKQAVEARKGQLRLGDPLLSDSLDDTDKPGGTYDGMMRQNAQRIVEGLTSTGTTAAASATPATTTTSAVTITATSTTTGMASQP